jgi:glycerol-3-phosphate cytidylyltransferase-like family protein
MKLSKRSIFVTGSFDCAHEGHRNLFLKARKIIGPDGLVIGVINSDKFFTSYKGFKPTDDEMTRLANVRAFGIANQSFIVPDFSDQAELLDEWRPTLVLHGLDWTSDALYKNFGVTAQWLEERDILFVYVDRTPNISSSQLRQKRKVCDRCGGNEQVVTVHPPRGGPVESLCFNCYRGFKGGKSVGLEV